MDIPGKLRVLVSIAKLFNGNQITWALGGSLLLYIKSIAQDFNDIDIMIAEEDIQKAKMLLEGYGALKHQDTNTRYGSKAFLEYVIDGAEIDLIAGFTIHAEDGAHYFPLSGKDIEETVLLDGTPIPLQSVEAWKTYYSLMGKTEKVKMIETANPVFS